MGNCFSTTVDFWTTRINLWLEERGGYTHNLEKNLTDLEKAMEDLMAKQDTLLGRVKREEDRGLQRAAEIKVWLTRVETIEKKFNVLLSAKNAELERLSLCGFWSDNLTSSYRYGESVLSTLRDVKELENRNFDVVADKLQTSEVEQIQPPPIIVGQETMLHKAWKHLREDGVGIMGFFGMGGVGKTTLLTQINNKFSEKRCGFEFVIWVVVSKELQVEKIRDEIAHKVGLGGEEWNQKDKSLKGIGLYNFLKEKRFVLFLDDLWQKIDLAEIGVPFPTRQNRCKVAFTTRSQDVCAHMGVQDPMEVQCLADNDAFDLFQKKVGEITLGSDPEIPDLARIVAKKCYGLPLALNVIGETMSCKRTVQEWCDAIYELTEYTNKFSGMEDKILPLLKYSYDNLKGEQVKSCLLYCALFPEDIRIYKERLIYYWIGEGIIDASEVIERAENKGYEIIGNLVRASLLMKVQEDVTNYVRIHDVVREMALWIASDFIVHAGVGLSDIPKVKNFNVVRRMSLMHNRILHLAGSPECLELTTLLMEGNCLGNISSEFFKSMPKLVVLDLSRNQNLSELPAGISQLVSLQYLDLSWTNICHLPKGLQELKKLIRLDLMFTRELSSIAGISRLHNLKVLNLCLSGFSWDPNTVEELETLEHLQVLFTGFRLPLDLEHFLSSHRLTSCTRSVMIMDMDLKSSGISIPITMKKLRRFIITEGCIISEIKMVNMNKSKTGSPLHNPRNICFSSLSDVFIQDCKRLRELTWLVFAPNLISLFVVDAYELKGIIKKQKAYEGEESGIAPFLKLTSLYLQNLPELKNIYWRPLPFARLKKICVMGCPNLKKLPLDSQSGKHGENGLVISYSREEWIEGVEWEDDATKTRFLPSCKKV